MKQVWLLLLTFHLAVISFAQNENISTYKYKWGVDAPIMALTVGSSLTGFIMHKNKKVLTAEDISLLNSSQVNKFDRSAIFNQSKSAKISSDVLNISFSLAPALLFIDKKARSEWKYIVPMWAEVYGLTFGLTAMTKELVQRKRPYVYNENVDISKKVSKDATSSFFSGHTSLTAASTFFMAKVYADLHPDSKFKPLMWTGAAIVPALTGLCRYKAGKHYFTDILVGYAVGSVVGILVPQLHKNKLKK